MCQLFVVSSKTPVAANGLLREFFSHAAENPHGWGVADLSGVNPMIIRSAEPANKSAEAQRFIAVERAFTTAMAHIRKATVGALENANCHPFVASDTSGREWVLMHKGTIFDFERLNPYFYLQSGSTDSERILLYFIDQLGKAIKLKGAPLGAEERFEVFVRMTAELSPNNCLNLVAYDGDYLYVFSNYWGGLNILEREESILLATSPLEAAGAGSAVDAQGASHAGSAGSAGRATDAQGAGRANDSASVDGAAKWRPFTLCTAHLFKEGSLHKTGCPCAGEYHDKESDTRYLNIDYAAL